MSDKRGHRLSDIPHQVRDHLQGLPDRLEDMREGLREDPLALFRTPAVRVTGLIVIGIVVILLIKWFVEGLQPTGSLAFQEATPYALLYVACANPDCRAAYTTRQPMDFDSWPLTCEKCGQPTVYRATLCKTCGHWFAVPPGTPAACPHCAQQTATAPAEQTHPTSGTRTDDDEDPWGP